MFRKSKLLRFIQHINQTLRGTKTDLIIGFRSIVVMNDKLLAILVLIGAVIYFFAQVILPIILILLLIGGLIYLYTYFREKIINKREEKESLEQEIASIERRINTLKGIIANDPLCLLNETVFLKSYLEILLLNDEISKERYKRQYEKKLSKKEKADIDENINKKTLMIDDHEVIDSHVIDTNLYNEYTKLYSFLVRINMKCDVWEIRNNTKRVIANFTTGYLYGVVPNNKCKAIWTQVKGVKYYFYPNYVVQQKGEFSIECISYDKISPKLSVITESADHIRAAKAVGYTYLHTCIDGTPDLRYKYNPRSTIYEYRLLQLMGLSNFTVYITSNAAAGEFSALIKQLSHIAKGNAPLPQNKDNGSPDKKQNLKNDVVPHNQEKPSDELLDLSIMIVQIFKQFGKGIVTSSQFIHILDDYRAFNDENQYVRNIIRLLQSTGFTNEMLLGSVPPQRVNKIKSQLSRQYAIQNKAVEDVITMLIFALDNLSGESQ